MTYQYLRANNLVMWTAIKYYLSQKFESLDMGRTEIKNNGLVQFKNGWGVEQKKLYYHKIVLSKKVAMKKYPGFNAATQKLISNLPIPFLRLIGNFAYRHIG
jgi:hypothetical protein